MKWDDFIAQLMLLCACRQIRTTVLYFCCKVGYRWDMKFCFCSLIVIILHDCLHDHHDHHHAEKALVSTDFGEGKHSVTVDRS